MSIIKDKKIRDLCRNVSVVQYTIVSTMSDGSRIYLDVSIHLLVLEIYFSCLTNIEAIFVVLTVVLYDKPPGLGVESQLYWGL